MLKRMTPIDDRICYIMSKVTFQIPEAFPTISTILAEDDCSLEKLMAESDFYEAYRKQHQKLISFLITNVKRVVLYALGLLKIDGIDSKKICLDILLNTTPYYTPKISLSQDFVLTLDNFLYTKEEPSLSSIVCYSRIVIFYCKYTNGDFLIHLPHRKEYISKLLSYMHIPAIHDLLFFICSDGHPLFAQFLEISRAGSILWSNLPGEKYQITSLLSHVINSVEPNSPIIKFIATPDKIEIIFGMAIQKEDQKLSNAAMDLLYELCGQCDEDDLEEEGSLFNVLFSFLIKHGQELCDYISSEDSFPHSKSKATELLVGVITVQEEVPEYFLECAGKLFNMIFIFPRFSIMHCSVMSYISSLFDKDVEMSNILKKYQFREKIVKAFAEKDKTIMYYGHLTKIASLIVDSEDHDSQSEEWKDFVQSSLRVINDSIEEGYGGVVPKKNGNMGKMLNSMENFDI